VTDRPQPRAVVPDGVTDPVTVGVDYGTLSGRAVVVRVSDGEELGSAVCEYPHAVLDRSLPVELAGRDVRLDPDWALQVPADYVEVLKTAVPAALRDAGYATEPGTSGTGPRSLQMLEIAIDAMDISSIRPFWRAVLGYVSEPGRDGPEDALVDPVGQGPAIWFQQMDAPRHQRNRIHFDLAVPHDQLESRLAAALVAGGALVADGAAPAFWVLADPEGNEICLTTWQGRD